MANFDVASVRRADGTPFGRTLTKALRAAGFTYDNRKRHVGYTGEGRPRLPFAYLGADDKAGPNYTGQPIYTEGANGLFLNRAAYVAPAAGQWGNAGRDSIIGPRQFIMNAVMGSSGCRFR